MSFEILKGLPDAGADIIELGMPFSDPMADGPTIQLGNLRALDAGITLSKTLEMVGRFREIDDHTPLILMGYFNPIYIFGVESFLAEALRVGIDGLIVVDLPPEEDAELCDPAQAAGLDFVRLATPTTDNNRLPVLLRVFVGLRGITYRLPGSPAPPQQIPISSVRKWRGCVRTPNFRSRSGSAFASPPRRRQSAAWRMPWWLARHW